MSTPPPLPPGSNTLSYATPPSLGAVRAGAVFAEGALIVSPPTLVLPARCVRCNEPESKRLSKRYAWHHPALFLLILAGVLIYAIVALVVSKKGTASFGLCALHAARRRRNVAIAWLVPLASIALMVAGPVLADARTIPRDAVAYFVIAGACCLVGGLIFAAVAIPILKPKYIDRATMKLAGAGDPFLATLGEAPRVPIALPA